MRLIVSAVLLAALCAPLGASSNSEYNPLRTRPTAPASSVHRVIVKMHVRAEGTGHVQALAQRAGLAFKSERAIGARLHALRVTPSAGESEAQTLARLRADADVEYAVADRHVYPLAVPNDPLGPASGGQWYLQAVQPSAINATGAWDITTGSDSLVIALIDSGVRFDHPDLGKVSSGGRLLDGYDFISPDSPGVFTTANDGDGRDADASDPGDWVTVADNCGDPSDSSWHGTRVAGMIGAMTNNSTGIAGVTWKGRMLPVRVIGKCGGDNSDVLEGMLWAAGVHVDNVPDNTNPAKIENVSLGSDGACDQASADVINQLTSLGVLVVVSAGNDGAPVAAPANCAGAVGVAGLRHAGTKVGYSNLGPEVTLAAPAGNCVNTTAGSPCLYSLDTTVNAGTTTPTTNTYTDQFNSNLGTSFSAPIVSGIAELMLSVNSKLTPALLIARLQEGARTFPTSSENANVPTCHTPVSSADVQGTECVCTTSVCGAGMADALGSVKAALRPIAGIVVQGTIAAGAAVTLQGGSSTAADGHSIASYAWVQGANAVGSSQDLSLTVPATGTSTTCLTVIDDAGKQDTARVIISQTSATVSTAPGGGNQCVTSGATVTVTATDSDASESGDTGTFTYTRTGDVTNALTVGIAVSGSATSGSDFQPLANSVTFPAGSATTTVTLVPIDDKNVDSTMTVMVTLQAGSGYTVGAPSSATISIANIDTLPPSSSSGGGAIDGATLGMLALMLTFALRRELSASRYRRAARAAARTLPCAPRDPAAGTCGGTAAGTAARTAPGR